MAPAPNHPLIMALEMSLNLITAVLPFEIVNAVNIDC